MAFNGSGSFNRLFNWVQDRDNSIKILAQKMDDEQDGIATGLSTCITKDGQTTVTADIPMSNNHFTGMDVGTANNNSVTLGQVQNNGMNYDPTDTGAADAYAIQLTPTVTALVAGLPVRFVIANTSTGPSTLAVDGLGTPAIEYQGAALTGAEMLAGATFEGVFDGTAFQMTSPSALLTTSAGDMTVATYDPAAIAEQLAGLTATQTLTGKTYDANGTGNVLTNIDIDNAIAASQAEAEAGTDNTKLVTSLRVAEAIAALASGGWEFVSASTASSSATIQFTGFEAGFDFMVECYDVLPVTDNVLFRAELGIAGPTYRTANYFSVNSAISTAASVGGGGSTSGISLHPTGWGNATNENGLVRLTIFDPDAAAKTFTEHAVGYKNNTGVHFGGGGNSFHTTAESMDAVQFLFASGNISTGEFVLYRRANV